jgi:hypothetical protein
MPAPPSIRKIAPSLEINDGKTARLSLADLKAILPSVEIDVRGSVVPSNATIKFSMQDLRNVLRVALSSVTVDADWYMDHVSGLRQDVERGRFGSPTEHYLMHGYLEGRLPERPVVDEKFYLQLYPDVAADIKAGRVKSAFEHYVQDGYAEGRLASADRKVEPK